MFGQKKSYIDVAWQTNFRAQIKTFICVADFFFSFSFPLFFVFQMLFKDAYENSITLIYNNKINKPKYIYVPQKPYAQTHAYTALFALAIAATSVWAWQFRLSILRLLYLFSVYSYWFQYCFHFEDIYK